MLKTIAATLTVATLACTAAQAAHYEPLHAFCHLANCWDGQKPWAAPVADANGDYYGITTYGGAASDAGTVYQMHFDGSRWVYKRLHAFCTKTDCPDGSHPRGGLVADTDGNLYGTTSDGGASGYGTIYRLAPDGSGGWTYKVLHTFCTKAGCPDGGRSFAALTYQGQASGALYDGTAPLYGATTGGGSQSQGVVFSLTPGAMKWSIKVLHNFCTRASCADGAQIYAPLTIDGSGTIFGVTSLGGSASHGTVFQLAHTGSGWKESVLHSFCAGGGFCADGDDPLGALVIDGSGDLVGVTYFGGAHAKGSLFKLTPNGAHSIFATLYSFCALASCADGQHPQGGAVLDAQGRLFGTTYDGGSANKGTVYKLSVNGTLTTLLSFGAGASAGSYPVASLTMGASGTLYGATATGGTNDLGLFYSVAP